MVWRFLKHFKLFIKRFSLEINSEKGKGSEREINSKKFNKKAFCFFRVEDYVVILAKEFCDGSRYSRRTI